MRIRKDYTKRPRTVPVNIANSTAADEQKMSGGASGQGSMEKMIAIEKATNARIQRSAPAPNARMNKK